MKSLQRRPEDIEAGVQTHTPAKIFQASVGTSLTRAGKGKIKCGRPLLSPEAGESAPPCKRPTSSVPPDVRKDGIDHFPTWETRETLHRQSFHPCLLREM